MYLSETVYLSEQVFLSEVYLPERVYLKSTERCDRACVNIGLYISNEMIDKHLHMFYLYVYISSLRVTVIRNKTYL